MVGRSIPNALGVEPGNEIAKGLALVPKRQEFSGRGLLAKVRDELTIPTIPHLHAEWNLPWALLRQSIGPGLDMVPIRPESVVISAAPGALDDFVLMRGLKPIGHTDAELLRQAYLTKPAEREIATAVGENIAWIALGSFPAGLQYLHDRCGVPAGTRIFRRNTVSAGFNGSRSLG